jgi:D-lactate dehydrogenase (cytochrome)
MSSLPSEILNGLRSIFPATSISFEEDMLAGYSHDESSLPAQMPQAVVWPETTEQVAALLKFCNEHLLPVTARGGGTSLEGNSIPSAGSIVLSLEKMNKVLEILPQDFQVCVQPGVIYDDLNKLLSPHGLFFAPGPSSGNVATIGGMVGNNAGGLNALRYGVTRNHVLRLQVVLADGSMASYGTRAMKTSSGFDLAQLMVGSEGMLGIVTEITLRLHGLPERRTVLSQFNSLDTAAQAVFEIMSSGILPGALELIDSTSIHQINQYKRWNWAEVPTLLIEFHGTSAGILEEIELVKWICSNLGAAKFELAATPEISEQLWTGRKEITDAAKALYPGYIMLKGDIAVPLSQFAPTIRFSQELGEKYGLPTSIFGHAGDGNIHWHTLVPPNNTEALAKGEQAAADLIRHALSVGGTASAEHGIGLAKRDFLLEEHGPSVEVMKKIKRALDPNNILNPGKMFPPS